MDNAFQYSIVAQLIAYQMKVAVITVVLIWLPTKVIVVHADKKALSLLLALRELVFQLLIAEQKTA